MTLSACIMPSDGGVVASQTSPVSNLTEVNICSLSGRGLLHAHVSPERLRPMRSGHVD